MDKIIPKTVVTIANLGTYLDDHETEIQSVPSLLALFSYLLESKLAYSLQGHYGRVASDLINDNWLKVNGAYTDKALNELAIIYPDSIDKDSKA